MSHVVKFPQSMSGTDAADNTPFFQVHFLRPFRASLRFPFEAQVFNDMQEEEERLQSHKSIAAVNF